MYTQTIAKITGTLTLLLALSSFILSFNALTDLASQHNISIPFLFPLVVEAGVIIFSLNALHRSIQGEHARWQWFLIIGSSLIAGTFNVLHAEANIVSRVMAAMPSLFLLLSFESFLNQIKHGVARNTLLFSLADLETQLEDKQREMNDLILSKQTEVDRLNTEVSQLNEAIEQAQQTLNTLQLDIKQTKRVQHSSLERAKQTKAQYDAQTIERRRDTLLQILSTERDIGVSVIAAQLHISRNTVYSDLKALSEAGHIHKNGNGWEVIQ